MRTLQDLTYWFPRLLLVLTILFSGTVAATDAEPQQQLQALEFLAGTWSGEMFGGKMVAHYSTPEGGMVLSYTELNRGGEIAFHEFERFSIEDGTVVFSPYPGGKPAIQMRLAELDSAANRVVFENPDKDFPTRITYHRTSPDQLVITLTDPHNDSEQEQRYEFQRQR